jgi:amino acid adenylation domain-containing protein
MRSEQLQVTPPADFVLFQKQLIDNSIASIFENIVSLHPNRVAIKLEEQVLTYEELNEAANRVAHTILAKQPWRSHNEPESKDLAYWEKHAEPVAVYMEQGIEAIIAIFGLLKAGKIFISIDPDDPNTRNGFILSHAPARVILTNDKDINQAKELAPPDCDVINIDQIKEEENDENPDLPVLPLDPALLVYTSGSTGQPKGLIHSQRNLLHDIMNKTNLMKISPSDRLSLLSWATGQAIKVIFCALLNGASLHLFNLKRDGVTHLAAWMKREKISLQTISAPLCRSFIEMLKGDEEFPDLRAIRMASDTVHPEDVTQLKEHFSPHCFFIHTLASIETGNVCALVMNQSTPANRARIPVGYPLEDIKIKLVDENDNRINGDEVGRIVITSRHITRGYWRRPDLTNASFVLDPVDSEIVTLRSNDLARKLPDGALELCGRSDFQVKIRGYRVETAEVEAALLEHENVIEAVVHADESLQSETRLVGYIVPKTPPAPTTSAFYRFLSERLPEYMIPAAFVILEKIPLLPNGKTNRKALLKPGNSRPELDNPYVAPTTPTEEALAAIWSQVIGIEKVGVHDHFMELGGDSLRAGQVMARIIDTFGVDLPLRLMFDSSTVAQIAAAIEQQSIPAADIENSTTITRQPGNGPWELSFGQKRLWFLEQLKPDSVSYNMPKQIRLTGELNVAALSQAIDWIIMRHEVLRTNYPSRGGIPEAVVAEYVALELPLIDLGEYAAADREMELQRLMAAETLKPFDLERDLKIRSTLYRLHENEHVLLCATHHIASDGWSRAVFMRELGANYEALVAGEPSRLEELPIQYSDFARWQTNQQNTAAVQSQLDYWTQSLKGIPPSLNLPTDRPRPAVLSSRSSAYQFTIPKDQAQALIELAGSEHVTMFMLLLAGFNALLYRYTEQEDLVVGFPVAGRSAVETEQLLGFFVNTLIMRNDLSGNPTFRELLQRVREQALSAYDNSDTPFENLVDHLKPERDLSRNPLFQVLFDVRLATNSKLQFADVNFQFLNATRETNPFDQAWGINVSNEGLYIRVQHSTDLFDTTTIERMVGHFVTLLKGVVNAPDTLITDLPILTTSEQRKLLDDWNDTQRSCTRDKCLHQLFEEQAKRTPNAVAVVFEDRQLTYEELNRRSNLLAHHLRDIGIVPETPVGLYMDRQPELLIGMLGILKAGGAFVPLDTLVPLKRLEMLITDARLTVLVSAQRDPNFLECGNCKILTLDEVCTSKDLELSNPQTQVTGENAAYVLYTSGSTGNPKAVVIEHRQWINYVEAIVEQFAMDDPGVFAMVQPLTVDSCQTMIFPALIHGSTLHLICRERSLDASALADYFESNNIDYLKIAPSHLWALLSVDRPERLLPQRCLILGGEPLHWKHIDRIKSLEGNCQVWNHYGPTETTVGVLTLQLDSMRQSIRDSSATVPIGRPLGNVRCYVMDRKCQLVPVGIPGELYIGGDSVARGYLNNTQLTEQLFVPDPFSNLPGARLYRTGDIVRWLPEGELEFLGRKDTQVKLRGSRIELGEIESVLEKHPGVAQSALLLREDVEEHPYLAAYVVPKEENQLQVDDLRQYLEARLPEIMIPSSIVFIETMPRTEHGKVDKNAFPEPQELSPRDNAIYVPPRTPIEEQLAAVWREVLRVNRVGIHDNFFELGGHSLLATQVTARTRERFDIEYHSVSSLNIRLWQVCRNLSPSSAVKVIKRAIKELCQ